MARSLPGGVVCILPPTLDLAQSYTVADGTFDVWIVGGPGKNYDAAWDRADAILRAIAKRPIETQTARPEAFAPDSTQAPAPAYVLTLTEEVEL